MLVVAIYQIWEEHYRELLATAKRVEKNDILSDLFGDLRRYRQSIVHHRSIALADVSLNKSLHWTGAGSAIEPSSTEVRELLTAIRAEVENIATHFDSRR